MARIIAKTNPDDLYNDELKIWEILLQRKFYLYALDNLQGAKISHIV